MPLAPRTPAPDFTLRSTTPETADVRLSDNFGKRNTVLLFFPGAFTAPCTAELCGIAKGQFLAADENTAVYGISVDSPVAQKAWADKEGITSPLLSDYGRQTIHAYDVVLPNFFGTQGEAAARAVYVIDRDGVIRYAEQTPAPAEMPNFEAVQAAIASL
jgi:glutaredoxin-dependent peroxiredoxin